MEGLWTATGPGRFEELIEKLWRWARIPHQDDTPDVVAELCELYPDATLTDSDTEYDVIDLTNDDFENADDVVIDLTYDDDIN